jgi:hypothetical protein
VRELSTWQSLVMGIFWVSGKLVVLLAVLTFLYMGNHLTAEKVFVTVVNRCFLSV